MKLKLFIIYGLCFHCMYITAQTSPNVNYTVNEYQTFAKIYRYTLDHPFDIVTATKKHINKITISEKRLGTILQAQFAGQDVQLSKAEVKELQKLQELIKGDQEAHQKMVTSFIEGNKMSPEKYDEMRRNYDKVDKVRSEINKLSANQ